MLLGVWSSWVIEVIQVFLSIHRYITYWAWKHSKLEMALMQVQAKENLLDLELNSLLKVGEEVDYVLQEVKMTQQKQRQTDATKVDLRQEFYPLEMILCAGGL